MRWIQTISLASLPFLLAASPSGPPAVNVNSTCHAEGVDKAAIQSCINSENSAKDELKRTWAQVPRATRQNCGAEIKIGGAPSYVDLLTCIQMDQWSRQRPGEPTPAASDLRTPSRR